MKQKKMYDAFAIEKIECSARTPLLAASVVNNSIIRSVGQETETVDFSTSDFELDWETNFE